MAKSLGIDLGSANSAAASTRVTGKTHETEMIPSRYGETKQGMVFPSYVEFDATGEFKCFGEEARRNMAVAPRRVVWGVKRLIGRTYGELTPEDKARFQYPIEQGENNEIVIPIGAKRYAPEDIARIVLQKIREDAEDDSIYGNPVATTVDRAIVTRPAYFLAPRTEATRNAATAVFEKVTVVSEPEAAALAYGIELDPGRGSLVMTVDWGAGTLDLLISVLTQHPNRGVALLDSAYPPCGHPQLGGMDMDDALIDEAIRVYGLQDLAEVLLTTAGSDTDAPAPANAQALKELGELRLAVEGAKIDLATRRRKEVDVSYRGKPLDLKVARSAADVPDGETDWVVLEDVIAPQLREFRQQVADAVERSGLAPEDIGQLLLVGGPMKMPCVLDVLADIFVSNAGVSAQLDSMANGGFPVDPMECVARGAALYAVRDELADDIIDIPKPGLPHDYGLLFRNPGGVRQGKILVPAGSRCPIEGSTDSLGCIGTPGDVVPISLYYRVPQSGEYLPLGEYGFHPTYAATPRGPKASFSATLSFDGEDVVRATLLDENSGQRLELKHLNRGEAGRPIPEPKAFGDQDPGPDPGPGPHVPTRVPDVPAQLAQRARNRAIGFLAAAEAAQTAPGLAAGARSEIGQRHEVLSRALQSLPQRGDSPQDVYQAVQHGCEELRDTLIGHGLYTTGSEAVR